MDAVILDVGGVLLVPHADAVNPALEPFGVHLSPAAAEHAHYLGVRSLDAAETDGRHEGAAYLDGYVEAVGLHRDQREQGRAGLREVFSGPSIDLWRQPVRGSVEGLRRLAATGIKLGIISNADGTIEEQLRRGQICQVGAGPGVPVVVIVDSTAVGVAKPAAEIFRFALDPLDVRAERALYVGDTVRYDVRGARNAGLSPVHFDPYELCQGRADHVHVRTVAEVEALV